MGLFMYLDILTFIISAIIITKTYRGLNTEGVQNA